MVESYKVTAELDASGFKSGSGQCNSALDSIGNKADAVGSRIGSAFKTAGLVVAAAFAGFATIGVKSFMDIESSAADAASKMDLSEIAKKSGKSVEESFKGVKDHIIALSRELGQLNTNAFDPTEIAAACANLAAGGFDVATASAKDLTPILSLATATNYDLGRSAALATSTLAQYGFGIDQLGRVSDVYSLAAGKSKAQMEDFDLAMQQAGPVAKGVGVSFEQLTAMISTAADAGYGGEKSGTALRFAMLALTSPTKAQSEVLSKLGLTYDDVNPRQHGFMDTLDLLIKKGADIYDFGEIYGKEAAAVTFTTAQQSNAVKGLTIELEHSQGAAERMAKMMLDTLGGSFEAAKGAAIDLAIGIGQKLAPTLKSALDWFSASGAPAIREFIEAVSSGDWDKVGRMIEDGIKKGAEGLSNLGRWIWEKAQPSFKYLKDKIQDGLKTAFAFSGSMVGLNLMKAGFTSMLPAIMLVSGALTGSLSRALATVRLGFITTWATALGPIAGIVVGVALIIGGLAAIGYALDPGKFTVFNSVAVAAFNGVKDVVTDVWSAIEAGDWGAVTDRLKQAFQDAISFVQALPWAALGSELMTMAGDGARAIVNTAFAIGDWIHTQVTGWISAGGPRQVGRSIGDAILAVFGSATDFDAYGAIGAAFTTIIGWASLGWQVGSGIAVGILDKLKVPAKEIGAMFVGIGAEIQNAFITAFNMAGHAMTNFINKAVEIIPGIRQALTEFIKLDKEWQKGGDIVETWNLAPEELYPTYGVATIGGYSNPKLTAALAEVYGTGYSLGYKVGAVRILQDMGEFAMTAGTISDEEWAEAKEGGAAWSSDVSGASGAIGPPGPGTASDGSIPSVSDTKESDTLYSNGLVERKGSELTDAQWNSGQWRSTGKQVTPSGTITPITSPTTGGRAGFGYAETAGGPFATWTPIPLINTEESIKSYKDWFDKTFGKTVEDASEKIGASGDKLSDKIDTTGTKFAENIDMSGLDFLKTSNEMTGQWLTQSKQFQSDWGNVGKTLSSETKSAASYSAGLTNAAANAITLGGGAVRIGLTEGGQQIAVIGSVAQRQFEAAGGRWLDATTVGSQVVKTDFTTGSGVVKTDLTTASGVVKTDLITGGAALLSGVQQMLQAGKSLKDIFDVTNYARGGGGAGTATGGTAATQNIQQLQITQEMIDKARENADEYGMLTLGLDEAYLGLAQFTAESKQFCEAISGFGLVQENYPGLFQPSFIGTKAEYAAFQNALEKGGTSITSSQTKANQSNIQTNQMINTQQLTNMNQVTGCQLDGATQAKEIDISAARERAKIEETSALASSTTWLNSVTLGTQVLGSGLITMANALGVSASAVLSAAGVSGGGAGAGGAIFSAGGQYGNIFGAMTSISPYITPASSTENTPAWFYNAVANALATYASGGTALIGGSSLASQAVDSATGLTSGGQALYSSVTGGSGGYSADQLAGYGGWVPAFQHGGFVPGRRGGTLARLAEAGGDEYVIPARGVPVLRQTKPTIFKLDLPEGVRGGGQHPNEITINLESDWLKISRKIMKVAAGDKIRVTIG